MNKIQNLLKEITLGGVFIMGFLLLDYCTLTDNQAFGFILMCGMGGLMFVYYKNETDETIKKLKETVNKK